ncbi:MAG: hypothetical protein JSV24_02615, partial [Bacteroidales bacterium]
PGHFELIEPAEMKSYLNYITQMKRGIQKAIEGGKDIDYLLRNYSLQNAFPDLLSKEITDNLGNSLHEQNIISMWETLGK